MSQAESYFRRGEWFRSFSAVEFECIVDVLPVRASINDVNLKKRGRPQREGFAFASTHPFVGIMKVIFGLKCNRLFLVAPRQFRGEIQPTPPTILRSATY